MNKATERTIGLYLKVSPKEKDLIKEKMKLSGIKSQRAYLRKMAVDGYVIQINFTLLKEMVLLLRNISSNINQIACRVNATGNFYEEDFIDIKEKNQQIFDDMCILLEKIKQW